MKEKCFCVWGAILNLLFYASLFLMLLLNLPGQNMVSVTFYYQYSNIIPIFLGLFWVVYICAACRAPGTKYINNTVDVTTVFKNIENAIAAAPICTLKIQNYHYETRKYKDKDGNTKTKKVRVNTHKHDELF